MYTQADLDNWFEYHSPDSDQVVMYTEIGEKAKELAELMLVFCPPCVDTNFAFMHLRNTVMAINLAIACNKKG